jgi:hypothetical protein
MIQQRLEPYPKPVLRVPPRAGSSVPEPRKPSEENANVELRTSNVEVGMHILADLLLRRSKFDDGRSTFAFSSLES